MPVLTTRPLPLSRLLTPLAQLVQQHPKRLTAALAAVLLTTGGGAFAVASLGPDAAELPMATISTTVPSLASDSTLAQLSDAQELTLYRSDFTRVSDSPEALLQRLGIADAQALAFLRSDPLARQHLFSRNGRPVRAQASQDHQLQELSVRWWQADDAENFQRLTITRSADGQFSTQLVSAPVAKHTRMAGGNIQSSLFAATDAAGIPDHVASQIADIFPEINFRRLFKGDRFTMIYETLEGDGELLQSNRILSAQFVNRGKTYEAMWFQEPNQRGSYYAMDGSSLRRAYLNSPVAFTRISSTFSNRFHPILKTWRKHLGTDFAAPSGTAIRTVGDGVVDFAGWQNGFGNVVYVKHTNTSHVTVYAHMSRIDVKKGQRVEQGDNLGAVGATGWATGPHLHFEFRVNGQHQNPQTIIAENAATPLSEKVKQAFTAQATQMREQLTTAALVFQTSAQ